MLFTANADTQGETIAARTLGIAGVCLFRTEPMFLESPCLSLMRIVASTAEGPLRESALAALRPLHQARLESIFRMTTPEPVHIRLLDPSLQKFLPSPQQLEMELSCARADEDWDRMFALANLRPYDHAASNNPVRAQRDGPLGLRDTDVFRMQVSAIFDAMVAVTLEEEEPQVGILLPMISSEEETRMLIALIQAIAAQVFAARGVTVPYKIGALLESPRALLCAGPISRLVDFATLGLHGVTAATYGVSRKDAGQYVSQYLERGVFEKNPFVTIDREGVGELLALAVGNMRKERSSMEIGAYGNQTGDAESLRLLASLGVDFLSCGMSLPRAADGISFLRQAA